MSLIDNFVYSLYAFLYFFTCKRYEFWYNLNVSLDQKCSHYEFKYWKGKKKLDE